MDVYKVLERLLASDTYMRQQPIRLHEEITNKPIVGGGEQYRCRW